MFPTIIRDSQDSPSQKKIRKTTMLRPIEIESSVSISIST